MLTQHRVCFNTKRSVTDMTFEKYFVAVRHESELLTPLIQSPVLNFSLREMAYLGVFGLSAVFAAIGAIPIFFAAGASPFLVMAFLRISGEIPEMYLYYVVVSMLQPKKRAKKAKSPKKKKNKKDGRQTSDIMGFGRIAALATINTKNSASADETIQSVLFAGNHTPIEMTLEIGFHHRYKTVTVLIDGQKILHDATNGAGQIKITVVMPQAGKRRFSVKDDTGMTIITKTVEFTDVR